MSNFVARPNNDHSKPRHWLPGATMTALVATMTVIFCVTEVRAGCESEEAAFRAGEQYLQATGAIYRCDSKTLTQQQIASCEQFSRALDERNKCNTRELQKEQAAKQAARAAANAARAKKVNEWETESLQETHDFMDALKIGMTAAETDAAEKGSFHNPVGWGRTVNTTVTANGTTEQWVYRFSLFHGAHDLYLYFQNGVLTASRNSTCRLGG